MFYLLLKHHMLLVTTTVLVSIQNNIHKSKHVFFLYEGQQHFNVQILFIIIIICSFSLPYNLFKN